MIENIILQSTGGTVANIINLLGAGLVLAMGYLYYIADDSNDQDRAAEAKRKGTLALVGFAFYTLIVATMGHSETWVGQIGLALDTYFERFAEQLIGAGEQSGQSGTINSVLRLIRTVGLIVYIGVFSTIAYSVRAPLRLYQGLFGN